MIERWSRRRLLGALLLLPLAVRVGGAIPAPDERPLVPDLPLRPMDGNPATLRAWLPERPTVLNLWATWCPPCRREMPDLVRLGRILGPRGIDVVTLSMDSDPRLVQEFALRYAMTLPVAIAAEPAAGMRALGAIGLPLTLYLDREHRILGSQLGPRDWPAPETVRELQDLLLP